MKKLLMATAAAWIATASLASADCGIASGSVRILSNDFEALHAVADWASKCASATVTVTRNQTADHKNIQGPALAANPAVYTTAIVANGSMPPLLNEGLIRPLDDLVAKFGQNLLPQQLIRVDGKIYAIAFMANAQHFFFREDILAQVGQEPPTTYEGVLDAAKAIRDAGLMQYPFALNMGAGWGLGQEFNNMYLGMGGEFFVPGSAEPAIENEKAVAALHMLRDLSAYMNPDYMTFDSNTVQPLWMAGELAMINMWGSAAGRYLEGETAKPEIAAVTRLAAAPSVGGNSHPATTVWWDGFTIAANITDEDAEASFRAMLNGISPQMMAENATAAVWLIDGYEPTPAAVGVIATIKKGGAQPYPMTAYVGILHTALGNNIAEFMRGEESAEQALADATAAYTAAAREAGFLK